jgi:hypothetical protein
MQCNSLHSSARPPTALGPWDALRGDALHVLLCSPHRALQEAARAVQAAQAAGAVLRKQQLEPGPPPVCSTGPVTSHRLRDDSTASTASARPLDRLHRPINRRSSPACRGSHATGASYGLCPPPATTRSTATRAKGETGKRRDARVSTPRGSASGTCVCVALRVCGPPTCWCSNPK